MVDDEERRVEADLCLENLLGDCEVLELGEGAGEDDTLLFAAGNLIHEAVSEMFGADLREGVAGDGDVLIVFETQRAAVGVPTL